MQDDDLGNWWLVVDCDEEIGRYYRHLYKKYHHGCLTLQRPSWKEHITVIRDEEPAVKNLWLAYDKKEINFSYRSRVDSNDEYYWLDVFCPELLDIREELGLPRQPLYPLHLTIGNRQMCFTG